MGLGDINGYIDENWHGGDIQGDLFSHPEMDVFEEKAEQPAETAKKPSVWNWRHAMTRELMRGKTRQQIMAKYRDTLERFGVFDEADAFLEENFGLLGWLVVDVDNFDEKFGYDDMPANLKAFNLYAVNATELQEVVTRSLVSENDGTIDGFFGSDDSVTETVKYVDSVTGLPCLDEDGLNGDTNRIMAVVKHLAELGWITKGTCDYISGLEDSDKIFSIAQSISDHFKPKFKSDGKYTDVSKEFGVEDYDLEADSMGEVKNVEVYGVQENKLDDIGDVKLLGTVDVQNDLDSSDFCNDFEIGELPDGDIDLEEIAVEDAPKDEIELENRKKDIEISNKYEWNW